MGLNSNTAGGIEICAETYQYIDFTTVLNNKKRRQCKNDKQWFSHACKWKRLAFPNKH